MKMNEYFFAISGTFLWIGFVCAISFMEAWLKFRVPLFLLILQTIWLLPALDTRAELHIKGIPVPRSNLHFYYVGIELFKVVCLICSGIMLFKQLEAGC